MVKKTKKKPIKRKASKNNKKAKKIGVKLAKLIMSPLIEEVSVPTKWFKRVKRKDAKKIIKWTVNKERIYEEYGRRYYKTFVFDKIEDTYMEHRTPINKTSPPTNAHSEEMILPDGKVVTPMRQFCETKVLPPGVKEAYFYNFSQGIAITDTKIESKNAGYSKKEAEKGTRVQIGYTQLAESALDIVSAINRSFALEMINDENREILNRCVNKHKLENWINNQGVVIVDDSGDWANGHLRLKAVFKAKQMIEDYGLDTSNAVLATSGKAIRDLIMSEEIDYYVEQYNKKHPDNKMSRPAIITQGTLEKLIGVKLFRTSAVMHKNITRSIMFIPNVSFGLVTARDLEMEAKKKLRQKVVSVTGKERVSALLKNPETVVRLSHD